MTDSSLLPPPLKRTFPGLQDFLKDISQENPVGAFLRYESLYDEVRLARQEDDPRLSMGIWKTDLKRADWGKIENLCIEALITKSKDLQIAAWLTEAWASLYGVEGYTQGIRLFSNLIETFWKIIHPQPQEDGDMENRLMIFEWMDTAFSSKLLLIPLTQSKFEQTAFGLGFFKSAQHSSATQKRVEKASHSPSKDPSKATGTTEQFQRSLDQTPDAYLSKHHQNMIEALQITQNLKDALSILLGAASPSFSQILGTLKEMERILKAALQTREPPPTEESALTADRLSLENKAPIPAFEASPPAISPVPLNNLNQEMPSGKLELKTRDDAYRKLEIIATFLEQNDPHSLAPQFLRQLIRWENKNILDIFGEIAKTSQEYDILMKILNPPLSEKK